MIYHLEWSKEAEITYSDILNYLQKNWTEKEVISFFHRTETVLRLIEKSPQLFIHSKKTNVHRAVLNRQISLYYEVTDKKNNSAKFHR